MSYIDWSTVTIDDLYERYGLNTFNYSPTFTVKEEFNMDKKFWTVHGTKHDSYESAEKHAKKVASQSKTDVIIMEAVAVATFPLANIEVNKLSADTKSK